MKSFAIFLGLFALVCAAPVEQHIETDPELTAGYFEGDMILDNQERNGMINTRYRWPNNTVYYKIAPGYFDAEHENHIYRGMRMIEEVSCIRFKEATDGMTAYSSITGRAGGCSSSVGYTGRSQTYNLEIYPIDTGCFRLGTVVHEFLHTLGFYHMQSDSHRDDYVEIRLEHVQSGTASNFNKYDSNTVDDFGQEYDYASVLHYPPYAFSKDGEMTIVPKQEEALEIMGQRLGMTKKDINKLNIMYKCPLGV